MVRERRSPRRPPGIIADPFDFLQFADEQQLEEIRQQWARTPRGGGGAAAPTGWSRTPLEITFSANGNPVFSDGTSLQDVWVDDDAYRDGGFGAVPASDAAIAELAVAAPGETGKEECAVCLEGFREGGDGKVIRKMPCSGSHAFHEACIFEWLSVSRVCPLCRFPLAPAEENTDDDESDAE